VTNAEKQTLAILIQSIELQLSQVRKMLSVNSVEADAGRPVKPARTAHNYTSPEEDRIIADVLEFEKNDELMQTIFKQAQEDTNGSE